MLNHLPKIIVALLLGMVFFMSGTEVALAGNPTDDAIMKQLNCGISLPLSTGKPATLTDCVPVITYYLVYKPASFILIGAGYIFDAMLTLSIDSSFVNQGFVDSTWTVVRDFSNMLFIFILIYTGVQTILGAKDWRNTVLLVVIMALLINFSLFFTKVVIDAGNVLAVGVYNSMGTAKSAADQSFQTPGAVAERDISGNLAEAFQPQSFLQTAGSVDALDATIVFLIAAIVSGYAGYIFFKAALLFIGRLIAFWFLMIVSPFAFISIALPAKANKFQSWLSELTSQAFVAPVFLFLVYLVMQVVGAGGGILQSLIKTSGDTAGAFTFDKVLAPVVIAVLVMMALDQALGFAKKMSGEFGALGAKLGGAVMGVAGGLALGGLAMGGRAVGGKLASKVFESGTMQRWASSEKGGLLGAAQRNLGMRGTMALDSARGASWDPRSIGLVAKGIKATGVDVGKAGGKGGYVEQEKTWIKDQKKKAALMEVPDKDKIKTEIKDRYGVSEAEKVASAQKTSVDTLASLHTDAQIAHTKAVRSAEATQTGAALKIAETKLNEQRKLVEDAKRKYDEQEKAFNSASASGSLTSEITASFENAKKVRGDAMSTLAATEGAVNTARQAHQATDEYKTVASTKEAIDEAAKNLERAKELKKEADLASKRALEQAEKDIKEESERRRESYAGARWTGVANLHKPFSAQERAEVIKKIREGKTEKEKEDEDLGKTIEKLAKKVKEQDKSGEKKAEEKKEEKAH